MISATTMMPPSNSLFPKRREKRRGQEQPPASRIEDVAWFQRESLVASSTNSVANSKHRKIAIFGKLISLT